MKAFRRYLTMLFLAVMMMPGSMQAQDVVDTMKVQLPEGWSRPTDDPVEKSKQEKVKQEKKKEQSMSKKQKRAASYEKSVAEAEERYRKGMAAGVVYSPMRYCESFQDFLDDKWITLDSATVRAKGNQDDLFYKTSLTIESGSSELTNLIKHDAFFVIIEDSMYVNMRKLKGPDFFARGGFARAYRVGKDKVIFGASRYPVMTGGEEISLVVMFGMVGGAVMVANKLLEDSPELDSKRMVRGFVITGDHQPIQWMNEDYMSALLGSGQSPEILIPEYQSIKNVKRKELFSTQKQFLKRAGLLSLH